MDLKFTGKEKGNFLKKSMEKLGIKMFQLIKMILFLLPLLKHLPKLLNILLGVLILGMTTRTLPMSLPRSRNPPEGIKLAASAGTSSTASVSPLKLVVGHKCLSPFLIPFQGVWLNQAQKCEMLLVIWIQIWHKCLFLTAIVPPLQEKFRGTNARQNGTNARGP